MKQKLKILFSLFLMAGVLSITNQAQTLLTMKMDSLTGLPGTQLVLPVNNCNFSNIIGTQFTIEWDTAVVTFDTVLNFGLPFLSAANFGFTLVDNGKLTFSWSDPMLAGVALSDTVPVFAIQFDLIGALGSETPVVFIDDPTLLEFTNTSFSVIPFDTVRGNIHILDTTLVGNLKGIESLDFGFSVLGNPIHHLSQISFMQETTGKAKVRMLTVSGVLIEEIEITATRGENLLVWETLFPESSLSTGTYLLELQTQAGTAIEKIMIHGE